MTKRETLQDLTEDFTALCEKHSAVLSVPEFGSMMIEMTARILIHHAPDLTSAVDLMTDAIAEGIKHMSTVKEETNE